MSIKKLSKKGAKVKREYKKVCDRIDEDMMLVYDCIFCKSCGTVKEPIDHSHNLPKGRFPEFETEEWNIAHRCRICHIALDHGKFEKIRNFIDLNKIMLERKEHAPGEYNKFVEKLNAVGCTDFEYVEF